MKRSLALLQVLAGTALAGSLTLGGALAVEPDEPPGGAAGSETHTSTEPDRDGTDSDGDIREATLIVQPPQARPTEPFRPPAPTPTGASPRVVGLFGPSEATRSLLSEDRRERSGRPGASVVLGAESITRPSSDAGSLLGKSQSAIGVDVQKRTPIVTDPRSRGTRTGQLLASGSYWVPARQDLDTMLSKIDSSIVSDLIVIKGPYSTRYGPGFSFIDFDLLGSPRYETGPEWHGRTSLNYQTNGEQWYGRQTLLGGSTDWGMRVGYGHRTGNDYESGDGTELPASYKSRDIDSALGFDLSPDNHVEFCYRRLDQTDVEFPGQVFDIDFLVTDAFDIKYTIDNQCHFDQLTFETWYNRTRFEGNAQNTGKRKQIPQLNPLGTPNGVLGFIGFTDVDAMSTGYRLAATLGETDCLQLTLGVDLRYVEQELNEFDTFDAPPSSGAVSNFPIPRSHSSNPGVFLEGALPMSEKLTVKAGSRADWVETNIEGTPPGRTRGEILGILDADSFDQDFNLWSAYVTAECKVDCHWTLSTGLGTGQRPPTLTELYAVDPFLAILQQGFTQVRGDPDLQAERLYQIDTGLKWDYCRFRGGIAGFYSWINNYITYTARDDTLSNVGLDGGLGVNFVNTDLATLSGGEIYGEYDWNDRFTPFGRVSYVEGRDHTRGDRGVIPGSDEEPLPEIAPLESRVGVRFHPALQEQRWGVEFFARVVDAQNRVAMSLLETKSQGFTTFDLRTYWKATDHLLLIAGAENLTDKQYREHLDLRTGAGVRQPGANLYFGCELNY